MIKQLNQLIKEYNILTETISLPETVADMTKYTQLAKEEKFLAAIIPKAKQYIQKHNQLVEDEEILKGNDLEIKEIAKDEIPTIKSELSLLENELKVLLLPRDPHDDKNTILEIRTVNCNDG